MNETIASWRIRYAIAVGASLLLVIGVGGCSRPVASERGVARIGDDLVGAHGELEIADSVPGDVMVAGGVIRFTGVVGGDYLGAGGQQIVAGRVGGSVRAAGGHVELAADVGRNATIAASEIEVGETGAISGNGYLAGSAVRLEGRVGRALEVRAGDVVIDGAVGGDATIEAGWLHIGPQATIEGDLTYRVRRDRLTIDPRARIAGRTIALPPQPRSRLPETLRAVWLIGFLVAGAALVLLFPGTVESAAAALGRKPGASIGWGFVWLIGVPIAAVILAITVIGVPLALVLAALYLVSLYLARAVPAVLVGRLVLRERVGAGRRATLLAFLVGGTIISLAELIPFLGPAVLVVTTIIGLGALGLAVHSAATRTTRPSNMTQSTIPVPPNP